MRKISRPVAVIMLALALLPVVMFTGGITARADEFIRRRYITAEQDALMDKFVKELSEKVHGTTYDDLCVITDEVNKKVTVNNSTKMYDGRYLRYRATHNPYRALVLGEASPSGVLNLCSVLLSRLGFEFSRPADDVINIPFTYAASIRVRTSDGYAYVVLLNDTLSVCKEP
jgi:hypothetical protein